MKSSGFSMSLRYLSRIAAALSGILRIQFYCFYPCDKPTSHQCNLSTSFLKRLKFLSRPNIKRKAKYPGFLPPAQVPDCNSSKCLNNRRWPKWVNRVKSYSRPYTCCMKRVSEYTGMANEMYPPLQILDYGIWINVVKLRIVKVRPRRGRLFYL